MTTTRTLHDVLGREEPPAVYHLAAAPRCALPDLRWPLYLVGAFVAGAALALAGATWLAGRLRPW